MPAFFAIAQQPQEAPGQSQPTVKETNIALNNAQPDARYPPLIVTVDREGLQTPARHGYFMSKLEEK